MSTVLVVEDDVALRWTLRSSLQIAKFEVLEAGSSREALGAIALARPDAVVLDLGLPDLDGLDTLRRLRAFSAVPVVVMTVRDALPDKIAALDSGADDYIVKPFEPDELLARVRANIRRAGTVMTEPPFFQLGDLAIDMRAQRVTWDGEPVLLTRIELRLLRFLVENRGRLLSYEELLDGVWGSRPEKGYERVRVAVLHLRRKLHDDAARPRLIFTEPGLGYRWISEFEEVDPED
jgi:two-component system KDP operon response regulator KdpE